MNEEQKNQNLINITFTDVMQIIASKDTNPEAKMVYIYLLNVIMDLDEKVSKLEGHLGLSTPTNEEITHLTSDDVTLPTEISEDVKWYEDNVKGDI